MFVTELDIDRHHKCVEIINNGTNRERGLGFTTSYLNLMLAEVMVGAHGSRYVYIGHNHNNAKFVKQQFHRMIIQEYGMKEITRASSIDNTINTSTNQGFMFLGIEEFISTNRLIGLFVDRIFLDVSDPIERLDHNQIGEFSNKVNFILHRRSGDLI